jgi:hypothetical protein
MIRAVRKHELPKKSRDICASKENMEEPQHLDTAVNIKEERTTFTQQDVATLFACIPRRIAVHSHENARFEAMRDVLLEAITKWVEHPANHSFLIDGDIHPHFLHVLAQRGFTLYDKPEETGRWYIVLPGYCDISEAFTHCRVDRTAEFRDMVVSGIDSNLGPALATDNAKKISPHSFIEQGVASLFAQIPQCTEPSFENARFEAMRAHVIARIIRHIKDPDDYGVSVSSYVHSTLLRQLALNGFKLYSKNGENTRWRFFLPLNAIKFCEKGYVDRTACFSDRVERSTSSSDEGSDDEEKEEELEKVD